MRYVAVGFPRLFIESRNLGGEFWIVTGANSFSGDWYPTLAMAKRGASRDFKAKRRLERLPVPKRIRWLENTP